MAQPSRLFTLALWLTLLLAAGPSRAASDTGSCRYVPIAKLPLQPGHPLRPLVDGSIDGKPATLLVDTGAPTTLLTRTATDRLGIPIQASGKFVMGVSGSSTLYTARLHDFSVGQVHTGRTSMGVIGQTARPMDFDAVFGADSMRSMDMEIALAAGFIQFFRATGCDDTFLAYWDREAMEIPFGGTERAPNKPNIIVQLNGKPVEAMINTGSPRTVVRRQAAERIGIRLDSAEVAKAGFAAGVGEEKVARWVSTFDSFTIGSETIKNARLGILDEASTGIAPGPDIILGADFLRAHRVLIAPSQRRLYVSYVGGEVFSK